MKDQRKAYLYSILAVICWSTIGSAFKISLRYLDFMNLLLYSSLIASLVLLTSMAFNRNTDQLFKLRPRDFLSSAIMGMLNPYLYYLVLLKAYDLLQAQEAGTLNYIWPLVLVLLSIPILHQKISLYSIGAVLISFFGIIIISTHGNFLSMKFAHPMGVLLAVGSAVFWALYWIMNIRDKREEIGKLFLNFTFGFLYILITLLVTNRLAIPSWEGITGAVYLGLFEMGITFVLWMKALKYSTTTAKVSNLIYLSPFISLIFIHFIVGETILLSTFIGLIFIVSGIIIQQYLKS
ncbi:MAG: DMT family transporter [Bacteroidota bacterium]